MKRGELGARYSSRYIGSMIADVHRTMIKGGVFLYPPTDEYAEGKLRLLYEANPIAFLVEQAGGQATNGKERILDVQPTSIHQRTPLVAGSPVEVQAFAKMMAEEAKLLYGRGADRSCDRIRREQSNEYFQKSETYPDDGTPNWEPAVNSLVKSASCGLSISSES